jgi:hypothetical protein
VIARLSFESRGIAEAQATLRLPELTSQMVLFADETAVEVLAALHAEAPVGKATEDPRAGTPGRLRDSIRFARHTQIGRVEMTWWTPVPYAKYVVKGHDAPGQLIVPVAANALMFYPKGVGPPVFASSSPGGAAPANDFPARVWDRLSAVIMARFRARVEASVVG